MENKVASTPNLKITFVIGAPGSGKSTLSKILAAKLNAHHLSVGDHLRHLLKTSPANTDTDTNTSPALGGLSKAELQQYLSSHNLVPADTIVRILAHKISNESDSHNFLIDGFPRDEKSGQVFEQTIPSEIERVIFFHCPKQTCKDRFLGRRREATDSEEVFEERYAGFEEKHGEVLQRYRDWVVKVDSSGPVERTRGSLFAALGMKE